MQAHMVEKDGNLFGRDKTVSLSLNFILHMAFCLRINYATLIDKIEIENCTNHTIKVLFVLNFQ